MDEEYKEPEGPGTRFIRDEVLDVKFFHDEFGLEVRKQSADTDGDLQNMEIFENGVFINCRIHPVTVLFEMCVFINCTEIKPKTMQAQNCVFVSGGKVEDTLAEFIETMKE